MNAISATYRGITGGVIVGDWTGSGKTKVGVYRDARVHKKCLERSSRPLPQT